MLMFSLLYCICISTWHLKDGLYYQQKTPNLYNHKITASNFLPVNALSNAFLFAEFKQADRFARHYSA